MSIQRGWVARLPRWAFVLACLIIALAGACVAFLVSAIVLMIVGVDGSDPVAVGSVLLVMLAGLILPVVWLRRRRRFLNIPERHEERTFSQRQSSEFPPTGHPAKTMAGANANQSVGPQVDADQANVDAKSRKFSLRPSERLYMEGYAAYIHNAAWVYHGDAYLTSARIVYCKKNPILFYLLAGPLLGHLFKGKKILFEISLQNLASVLKQKHGFGSKFVLGTLDGKEYGVQFGTRQERWLSAIKEAAERARPGIKTDAIGEFYILLTEQ